MKKTLYPKTKRIANTKVVINITEKLDGSNLGFFNHNGRLVIAQRNNVFYWDNVDRDKLYKGLYAWLELHAEEILERLYMNSGVFGEWIGMGQIKYGNVLGNRFHIFAKGRIEGETLEDAIVNKINYNHDNILWAFIERNIPDYMNLVKVVKEVETIPTVEELDELYDEYVNNVDRKVEGFVIGIDEYTIKKYVRFKNGKASKHKAK